MKRFYLAYADEEIWPQAVAKLRQHTKWPQVVAKSSGSEMTNFMKQLVAEIPWGHHRFLLDKVPDSAARVSAARHVNRDLILLYWDIGGAIVQKQKTLGWGDSVVEMVAADLRRAFPGARGFSANNVWLMRQFFSEYSSAEFLEQAVQEMERQVGKRLEQTVPEEADDEFLSRFVREMLASIPGGAPCRIAQEDQESQRPALLSPRYCSFGWSRNVLLNQIKARAYERAVTEAKTHNSRLCCRNTLGSSQKLRSRVDTVWNFSALSR